MLLSLLGLGIVGGTMAFKAKFIGGFCTTMARLNGFTYLCTDSTGSPLTCPNSQPNIKIIPPQVYNVYCTIPEPILGCDPAPNCLSTVAGLDWKN